MSAALVRASAPDLLALTLQRVGWEIEQVDLDLVAGRAVVELHRADGRWLWLHVDSLGRVHLERWHREARMAPATPLLSGRGAGPSVQSRDQFLGRRQCEGVRSGLRALAGYVADNPAPGFAALPAADVRRALAPLLLEVQP